MTIAALHNRLAQFLITLECLTPDAQAEAIANEVIETGGTYCPPPPDDQDAWASHMFEIQLHGISGFGHSEPEAIKSWKRAALRTCPLAESDGFITIHPPFPSPRNHSEEIANARAAEHSRTTG